MTSDDDMNCEMWEMQSIPIQDTVPSFSTRNLKVIGSPIKFEYRTDVLSGAA
jgi:hypothetical protein